MHTLPSLFSLRIHVYLIISSISPLQASLRQMREWKLQRSRVSDGDICAMSLVMLVTGTRVTKNPFEIVPIFTQFWLHVESIV